MPEILVAGETLVDFIPDSGGTVRDVDGYAHRPGGAPANVAAGLARLGTPPVFWTRLSEDPFGEFLRHTLREESIPPDYIQQLSVGNTTLAVVSPPAADDRRFRFYGDGDVTFGFDPAAVPTDALVDCSWVHLGGVALTHPRGREAMCALATAAAERDCTVSFDVNYRPDLIRAEEHELVREALHTIVAESDVVFCSDEDMDGTGLSSQSGAELAHDLLRRGPHTAVVTLGGAGALASSTADAPWGATDATHPGFSVPVRDTTGAGDAFTAGLIRRLAPAQTQASLDAALAFANATAAESVQKRGGISSLPTTEAVEERIARDETA